MWNLLGNRELKVGKIQRYSFLKNFWLHFAKRHKGLLLSLIVLGFGLSYVFLPDSLRLFNSCGRADQYCKGIANSMNFCYLNSDIQLLSSSNQFIKYLNSVNRVVSSYPELFELSKVQIKSDMSFKNAINYLHLEISKFIQQLNTLKFSRCTLSNYHLINVLNKYISLNLYDQQDSYEFLQILIDLLEKEYKEILSILKDRDDLIKEITSFPFNGKNITQMKCLKCGGVSTPRKSDISTMSLVLSKSSQSLQSLIKENNVCLLDDYNCVQCKMNYLFERIEQGEIKNYEKDESLTKLRSLFEDNDKKIPINYEFEENKQLKETLNTYLKDYSSTSQVLRQEEFYDLPQILAIQISRGRYNISSGAVKNHNTLSFDEDLVVSCTADIFGAEKSEGRMTFQEISHIDTAKKQLDATNFRRTNDTLFQLRSFIGHSGNHYRGHFQCFKKKPIITKEKIKGSDQQKGKQYEYHVNGEFVDTEYLGLADVNSNVVETGKRGSKNSVRKVCKVKGNTVTYDRSQLGKKIKRSKILHTVVNYPYWRISDSSVYEMDSSVLENQRNNVYMLLYETAE